MNKLFNQLTGASKQPEKTRSWFYQFPNEPKQELKRRGKYWYYTAKGTTTGCSSLADAKGDLKYSGAKVWSELS